MKDRKKVSIVDNDAIDNYEDDKSVNENNIGNVKETTVHKTRRGRGKASGDLKLSVELLAVNKIMQEKFIALRQAIFAPQDWAKQERVRHQRHTLAQILGVHDKLVRAIEKTPSTLPATVLFALVEYFNLAANYFTIPDVKLSEQFILEQRMREFEYGIINRSSSGFTLHHMNSRASSINGSRRGGWLKGLPRKAKDQNDAYLLALWNEAKKREFSPDSVEDMMVWAKDNSVEVDVDSVVITAPETKRVKTNTRRRNHNNNSRRGGWMLGLPRQPRDEEQKEQVRIWHIAQKQGLRFNSVKEMMIWWAAAGKSLE